mgnify:CR=1 FL=1
MKIGPDQSERAARLMAEMRIGLPVLLRDKGTFMVVAAAETLSKERLAGLRELGEAHISVTAHRARVLKAMVYDGDVARLPLPEQSDLSWVNGMADPARDLDMPMKGPFRPLREGSAVIDRAAIAFAKRARLLPAVVVVPLDMAVAAQLQADGIQTHDVSEPDTLASDNIRRVAVARVPLSAARDARVHVFGLGADNEEHYAIEIGAPDRDQPVLSRLHSACFTGDLMGSLKCDCGPQLRGALAQMGVEGAGVLLYLNQEGRGIGLANKMRAYSLQDQGFDTVEANHRLGFEDDERDFRIGAALLGKLGIKNIRLLTNNPAKIDMMRKTGIEVSDRVSLKVGENRFNEAYLQTKANKSGHLL